MASDVFCGLRAGGFYETNITLDPGKSEMQFVEEGRGPDMA